MDLPDGTTNCQVDTEKGRDSTMDGFIPPNARGVKELNHLPPPKKSVMPQPSLDVFLTLGFSFAPPGLIHADAARRLTPWAIFFRLTRLFKQLALPGRAPRSSSS